MDLQGTAQLLGNLGEFFGAIAVLATLIYLAIQIRQNKDAIEIDSTRTIIQDFQSIWATLGADENFTLVIRRAVNDWDALSRNEQMRAHVFFVNLFTHYTSAIKLEASAELHEFIVAWEDNVVGLLRTPGGEKWYQTSRYLYDPEAVARINNRLSDVDAGPPAWTELMSWWQVDEAEARLSA
jgi:hypothetical protein